MAGVPVSDLPIQVVVKKETSTVQVQPLSARSAARAHVALVKDAENESEHAADQNAFEHQFVENNNKTFVRSVLQSDSLDFGPLLCVSSGRTY
jgi:hypothetical protein